MTKHDLYPTDAKVDFAKQQAQEVHQKGMLWDYDFFLAFLLLNIFNPHYPDRSPSKNHYQLRTQHRQIDGQDRWLLISVTLTYSYCLSSVCDGC